MKEFAGSRFIAGDWANGFGIRFVQRADGSVLAQHTFDRLKQGPPGLVQGGALAAVLDEAMTAAVYLQGHIGLTVNLTIDYHTGVPLGVLVQISGRLDYVDRRKLFTSARIQLPDGIIAAEAKALFINTPTAALNPAVLDP